MRTVLIGDHFTDQHQVCPSSNSSIGLTRDASSFEVKVHSSPATVMPHTKPEYEVAENIGLFWPLVYHLEELDRQSTITSTRHIMFAIVLIKEINSLFAMGIFNKENPIIIVSRLMFCYHLMIYTALNLNKNFCWDSKLHKLQVE